MIAQKNMNLEEIKEYNKQGKINRGAIILMSECHIFVAYIAYLELLYTLELNLIHQKYYFLYEMETGAWWG